MSSIVAVAGGSGKLGRAIVEAIQATAKYQVIILGREVWPPINTHEDLSTADTIE